ncbi:MSMEG_0568 family radical SAM protein [Tistrella mobilis]|uniref:MSMEG_0568 family radical SAM protein n=1 Tax=Tistrella mobilis TaxID=171437 RepID=UPI0035578388
MSEILQAPMPTRPPTAETLINELQSFGARLADAAGPAVDRKGGAGPSDHTALTIGETTVMVPIHTGAAKASPYVLERPDTAGRSRVFRDGRALGEVSFPRRPRFYDRMTEDGVPYWKIATLHGRDVLATTVLQSCVRYVSRAKTCQFCAIGQSLAAGRTVERKTPAQLAEVARAAVELDGVRHMVMTTGTPPGKDRGAAILAESVAAVKAAVDLPVQVQCEPPDDDAWFRRLKEAGADGLGMHLEAVTEPVRARIMPGKAQVPVSRYLEAFAAAVPVFGRGQVSTYILAGLGDGVDDILAVCRQLVAIGVYPFVVPFVPISGTPLAGHPGPDAAFMHAVLDPLAAMLAGAGLAADAVKAGCARCGACSALSTYERRRAGHPDAIERAAPLPAEVLP